MHVLRRTNFREQISSLAELTRNGYHRWLSIRGNIFIAAEHAEMFKSRISRPNGIRCL